VPSLIRVLRPAALAVLFAGLLAACGSARSPYALDYPMPEHVPLAAERYRLDNGLEVILSPDHTVPLVAVHAWYHVGAKDDPPGRAGLAHLFEHLMFDGRSAHVAEGQHNLLLAEAEANDVNADTTVDRTAYHETVPRDRLELALWLESERMAFLLAGMDQDKLDRERRVVENELRQTVEQQPYGWVPAFVRGAAFPEPHPYHHLPLGEVAQLDAVTLDEARAFFRTWYVPGNCTLALVGDFDPTAAKALVTRYFGSIAAGRPTPERPDVLPSPLDRERRLTIEADVPLARVVVAWPVVPRFAPGSAELETGASPLAGFLRAELVGGQKLATSVSAWVDLGHLAGLFEVSIELAPGASPERGLAAFDGRMHVIRGEHTRYDRTGFAVTRAQLLTSPIFAAERLSSRATLLQLYNQDAGRPDFGDAELAARRDVLVEDVRKAYYDLLRWDRRIVAFVVPRTGAPRAGRLVGSP
jgi:predicted Zn-dependent peptidase